MDAARSALRLGAESVYIVYRRGMAELPARKEFVGGIHALQALAGDVHKAGQTGAGAYEHGLVAVLVHQLVDGEHLANDHIALKINAHHLQDPVQPCGDPRQRRGLCQVHHLH